jgi:hypothetical protein
MSESRLRRWKVWWRELDARAWRIGQRYYLHAIAAAVIVGLLLLLWAIWIEPNRLTINPATLEIPAWPAGFENCKIVALSDLHVGSPHVTLDKLRQIVQRTNEQNPDLIVLLGDYVIQGVIGGTFVEPEVFAEALKDLRAPLGIYAVLGNHDWWFGSERVTQALRVFEFSPMKPCRWCATGKRFGWLAWVIILRAITILKKCCVRCPPLIRSWRSLIRLTFSLNCPRKSF